jgi:hypothetical protein
MPRSETKDTAGSLVTAARIYVGRSVRAWHHY